MAGEAGGAGGDVHRLNHAHSGSDPARGVANQPFLQPRSQKSAAMAAVSQGQAQARVNRILILSRPLAPATR